VIVVILSDAAIVTFTTVLSAAETMDSKMKLATARMKSANHTVVDVVRMAVETAVMTVGGAKGWYTTHC
jgi:hypothetical protein